MLICTTGEIHSLLPPRGLQESSLGYQSWQQSPEPSQAPVCSYKGCGRVVFKKKKKKTENNKCVLCSKSVEKALRLEI